MCFNKSTLKFPKLCSVYASKLILFIGCRVETCNCGINAVTHIDV